MKLVKQFPRICDLYRCLILLLIISSSGCTIANERTAHEVILPNGRSVVELRNPPKEVLESENRFPAIIFLVNQQRLISRPRILQSYRSTSELLNLLELGATEGERVYGLRTAVPGNDVMNIRETTGDGTIVVDLNREFSGLTGEEQLLAIGQVVLTFTSITTISRVGFLLDGSPAYVPTADGSPSNSVVTRDDFISLLSR